MNMSCFISSHKVWMLLLPSGVPLEVHCRVLSMAHDIIDHVFSYTCTCKWPCAAGQIHVHLSAVAVRHLTGSKQVISLLNRFSHGVSATQLQEFETRLADSKTTKTGFSLGFFRVVQHHLDHNGMQLCTTWIQSQVWMAQFATQLM